MKKRNWGRVLFARGIKKNYLLLLFSLPPAPLLRKAPIFMDLPKQK
jgi:hypothetical protein